tara:strand:+ start:16445 stop:16816 length:372 start_codon:yes stop_codon:yes gene_type:complete
MNKLSLLRESLMQSKTAATSMETFNTLRFTSLSSAYEHKLVADKINSNNYKTMLTASGIVWGAAIGTYVAGSTLLVAGAVLVGTSVVGTATALAVNNRRIIKNSNEFLNNGEYITPEPITINL